MIILTGLSDFIGSLHPLMVHIPIGVIVAAILLELWKHFRPGLAVRHSLKVIWTLAALGAVASVICGLVLAGDGHYIGNGFSIHKWTGITLAVISSFMAIVSLELLKFSRHVKIAILTAIFLLLCITGHYGGMMTHGEDYLSRHLPFLGASDTSADQFIANYEDRDTVLFFEEIVLPILEEKCVTCHNEKLDQGNLDLSSYAGVMDDTFGDVVEKGNPLRSKIMKRVMLLPSDEKFMPPSGPPLSYVETRMLEWWITEGAQQTLNIKSLEPTEALKALLNEYYLIDYRKKSFYEKIKLEPLPDSIIAGLEKANFNVTRLAANNPMLDVSRIGMPPEIKDDELKTLLDAKEHITWLDLGGTNLKDAQLPYIAELPNLTRLRLQNTEISDQGIVHLTSLRHLNSLNLYGNNITGEAIQDLAKFKSLSSLYLYLTKITEEQVEELRSSLSETEIIAGLQ